MAKWLPESEYIEFHVQVSVSLIRQVIISLLPGDRSLSGTPDSYETWYEEILSIGGKGQRICKRHVLIRLCMSTIGFQGQKERNRVHDEMLDLTQVNRTRGNRSTKLTQRPRWVYLFFFNTLWVWIPLWILWQGYGAITTAMLDHEDATRTTKRTKTKKNA